MNKIRKEKGFTLVELMIALVILSLIGTALVASMKSGIDIWDTENIHTEILQNAVAGLDKMTRELSQMRQVVSVTNPTSGGNNYIRFKDVDGNDKVFQYNNGYVEYGSPNSTERLAGPITSLKFTYLGYGNDASGKIIMKDLGTNPNKDEIRLIKIEMVAKDAKSNVTVPVNSQVSVLTESVSDDDSEGEDKDKIKLQNYALFGFSGFQIKNNLWIGSYPTQNNPPANIGSYASGLIFNNLTLYGSIIAKGNLDLSNNDVVYGDVISGGNITVSDKTTITGSVNYRYPGTLTPPNFVPGGGVNEIVVEDIYFWNTLPRPVEFTSGTGTVKINNKEIFTPTSGTAYGNIDGKGGTLRFSGDGVYYFNSITGQMTIDITGITNGIKIFVKGNFDDKGSGINMTINGAPIDVNNPLHREIASKIYIEVQGNMGITPNNTLAGTIYACNPSAGNIVFKNSLTIVGALYGRGFVGDDKIPNNSLTIYYIPADENNLPDTWK